MDDGRLSNLGIISLNAERATVLSLDSVVDILAAFCTDAQQESSNTDLVVLGTDLAEICSTVKKIIFITRALIITESAKLAERD